MKQWKILIEQSAKARSSIVIGQWPTNCEGYTDFFPIKTLVEKELYRIGGDPTLGNKRSFPGGSSHDIATRHQPDTITPMTTALAEASKFLLDTLQGKEAVE